MGQFLEVSAALNTSRDRMVDAIRAYADVAKFKLLPPREDYSTLFVAEGNGHSSVTWPGRLECIGGASSYLSSVLGTAVFWLHIYDGDLWMFELYDRGSRITGFNSIPDYWEEELSEDERARWMPDITAICERLPYVKPADIRNYLVPWDIEALDAAEEPPRAYPDDVFVIGEDGQIFDFMRRLKLPCPPHDEFEMVTFRTVQGQGRAGARREPPPQR